MKDLVVKTVLITLASVLGVFLLVFGALALFSPITLANLFDGTGGYSSSIHFYERQYEKSGDIDDLLTLVVKINVDTDSERAEEYYAQLIKHEDFEEYCASEESNGLSSKEYYYGQYGLVLAKNNKFDEAIVVADEFVKDNGYTGYNPFTVLLFEQGGLLSNEQLEKIKTKIESYSLTGDQQEQATSDLAFIEKLKS